MHDTYGNSDAYEGMKLNYEEELTPKEINRHKKAPSKKGFASSVGSDDLLLILILFILLNEDKEDNSLAIIIAAILFMK